MSWQLLITIHTLIISVNMLLKRDLAKHRLAACSPFMVTAVGNLVGGTTGLGLAWLLGGVQWGALHEFAWRFVGGGLVFALSSVCLYLTFVYLDSVVASLLNTLGMFATIALAWYALGESLTWPQIIGGAVIVPALAVVLYSARRHETRRQRNYWMRGLIFAVLAAVFFALAATNEKYLVSRVSITTYMLFGWGFQTIMAVAIAATRRREYAFLHSRLLVRKALIVGATACAAGAFYVLAQAAGGKISLLTLVSNCRIILVALLAAWWLRERQDYWRRLTAAAVALAGLAIIFW